MFKLLLSQSQVSLLLLVDAAVHFAQFIDKFGDLGVFGLARRALLEVFHLD